MRHKRSSELISEKSNLESNGATYIEGRVVVDGRIITAPGPTLATQFGEAIKNLLKTI